MLYYIQMWYGDLETGILIARQQVKAENRMEALRRFIIPCRKLIEIEWDEISLRVEDLNDRV